MVRVGAILAMVACGGHTPRHRQEPFVVHDDVYPKHVDTSSPAPGATTAPAPASGAQAPKAPNPNRCDDLVVSEMSVDGLLDDWEGSHVVTRVGTQGDGTIALRCAWDAAQVALLLDIQDDRLVRVKGGEEDRVSISLAAGGKPVVVTVLPGNSMAPAKITKPTYVDVADSLQPNGFSVELTIKSEALEGFGADPAVDLAITFYDSDSATGGSTTPISIKQPIELGDRHDLFDDFLEATRLAKTDIKIDTLAELDPDREGKERFVAGRNVIAVLTDRFAYVALPVEAVSDVLKVELLPLGAKGQQIVSAVIRQSGNGGSRDLLMLWTVWSGQLQPLASIEIRKQLGANVLASTYKVVKGPGPNSKTGPELVVEPQPAVGFTAETWNEEPAGDADSIVLPWDAKKSGIGYSLQGAEIKRRDLPPTKKK